VPKITLNTINLFFLTAISVLVISNRNSFRVRFDKIASVYFISKKYIYILALEMASPGTRHYASCTCTLSFPILFFRISSHSFYLLSFIAVFS